MQPNLDPFLQSYANNARVRSDIGLLRQRFPNLSVVGDVVTMGNVAQRLIKFVGTVPIVYKGQTYHIPLTVWLPPSYPFQEPNIYVTPTPDMAIKPRHQHVDADGKCYLAALSQWHAQQSSLPAVVGELQGVFAVNPPVFAKPKDAAPVMPPSNPYGFANSSPVAHPPFPPPSYEHPSNGNNNNSKVDLLRRQANEALARECRIVADELTQFMRTQNMLENGQHEIDVSLAKLAEHKRQLQLAIDWTKKSNADLDEWLNARSSEKQQPVNVDEIVVPTSAVGAQLLHAVAANKAIEDALYVRRKWSEYCY
jgi:ESCRT-I complex subunit TSG101